MIPTLANRLSVAFVIDDLGFGGAQRQLSILSHALRDHVVPTVYCLSGKTIPFADRIRADGVEVIEIERRAPFEIGRLLRLAREMSARSTHVIHGFLDASNAYAFVAGRLLDLPVTLSLRNQTVRMRGPRRAILHAMLRRADRVTVNSRKGLDYAARRGGVSAERLTYVNNAVPPELLTLRRAERSAGTVTIGFVGRLVAQKRVGLLVESFARLHRERPEARLIIVGDGDLAPDLRKQIAALGVLGAVEMMGEIEDAYKEIARFDCLALPSAYEGLPNVVLEALSLGVPVVATDTGDVAGIVVDGSTGRLLREATPGGLASALAAVVDDEELRSRAAVDGPDLLRRRYSVGEAVDTLLSLYRGLARTPHK